VQAASAAAAASATARRGRGWDMAIMMSSSRRVRK
jgi:hypothetical protein